MKQLVIIALTRPLTFIVMSIMIVLVGGISYFRTPTDIFPNIGVPVVAVAWQFTGLSPSDMSNRIVTPYQRILTTTVNDIEHIEATSLNGIGIVKVFFQPGVDVRLANAQITAVSQTVVKQLPPGITPPLILNYNASTVPILQLAMAGQGLNEQQLFDTAQNFIRPRLVTIPGAAIPYAYGGQQRQIQIDLDPEALQSKGLSGQDVGNALAAQTQITPAGFVKIGTFQYNLRLNNAPGAIDELNQLPIKTVNGVTIRMADVAHVRDGASPQQNVVHVDGQRSVLMTVLKNGSASTVDIVHGIKDILPDTLNGLPPNLQVKPLNDQSIFVESAVSGVLKEGALAAALTSVMILLFLGSWRSTVIIAISIPLSVLSAIALLSAFGQTLNVMTLGGLALAVGLLVDDATVTIENINRYLEEGEDVIPAIINGANQILVPALVALMCICIVFVPMFFLPGVSGYLFVPMALAVVFSLISSFVLSRTLVPTMAMYLLRAHDHEGASRPSRNPLVRFQRGFEARFERLRMGYAGVLQMALDTRVRFIICFLAFALLSLIFIPFLGQNFFPSVDSGSIQIHVRGPIGTRVEETSRLFAEVEDKIRATLPPGEVTTIVDNIGLPNSGINTVYNASGTIGPQDGDIYINLKDDHAPTPDHVRKLREVLPHEFPGATFAFLPADITSQILNFGAPAPLDIQVTGLSLADDQAYAAKIYRAVKSVDGIADVRLQQSDSYPELDFNVDRSRINALGLTEADVTTSLGSSLAGTSQTAPLQWVDPKTNSSYPVVAQTPEYDMDSIEALQNVPISGKSTAANTPPQPLAGLGTLTRGITSSVVSQNNIRPLYDVFASTQGRDLGAVAGDVEDVLAKLAPEKPKTVTVSIKGQYETMKTAFLGLGLGLAGAIVMIYLLIVVNFQSWVDPFIIISALPAALAGISWMLFATDTTLSVPALTGAIMCMGVATANSILVVSFAREQLEAHHDPVRAAYEAGVTRFRPVLMTALAMVIGMLPMALGLGDGGEQNAPLGRAVIGGLLFATCSSLLFVPSMFAIIHSLLGSGAQAHGAKIPTAAELSHA